MADPSRLRGLLWGLTPWLMRAAAMGKTDTTGVADAQERVPPASAQGLQGGTAMGSDPNAANLSLIASPLACILHVVSSAAGRALACV